MNHIDKIRNKTAYLKDCGDKNNIKLHPHTINKLLTNNIDEIIIEIQEGEYQHTYKTTINNYLKECKVGVEKKKTGPYTTKKTLILEYNTQNTRHNVDKRKQTKLQ